MHTNKTLIHVKCARISQEAEEAFMTKVIKYPQITIVISLLTTYLPHLIPVSTSTTKIPIQIWIIFLTSHIKAINNTLSLTSFIRNITPSVNNAAKQYM